MVVVANPITRPVLPPGAPCGGVEEFAMRQSSQCRKSSAPRFCAEGMEPRVMLAASFVADLNKASSGNLIGMLGHIGNLAIFVEKDGVQGREPYSTDGTKAGTVLLRDINVG